MTDRFDHPPRLGRVGVHRLPERSWWRWWMTAIVAAAAAVVLTVGGLGMLQLLRVGGIETTEVAGPEAVTDPAALPEGTTVTILDASGAGRGQEVSAALQAAGWPVVAVADASEGRESSTVYYQGDLEPYALGLAQTLGTDATEATAEPLSGSTLTVIVGASDEPAPSPTP
ncbi:MULTISPECIES: LytR C-terminal domain-containing protein [unclassified Agrococcus]|uniref:LytR C-terminal domain-containing protein n=1 Tax=unclassified Agrococcus TaxID=2615065 RepID=UPI0036139021